MSDPDLFGKDLFGGTMKQTTGGGPVAEKFLFPPFSVLDTRQGEWIERRRAWMKIGIQSEIGREDDLTFNTKNWEGKPKAGALQAAHRTMQNTSVFDPVVCELVYRWFCPPGGQVVDPFCGGSVRGIIANKMGLKYWGGDLRSEQVMANEDQALKICGKNGPEYICGDSRDTVTHYAPAADLIFSCPPYGDLEVYSDSPKDLSAMGHTDFQRAYAEIIRHSVARLKPNRFAVFVVGDYRGADGFYRNFIGDTTYAFQISGAMLYNDAIILNSVGTASMRVTKQFVSGRKFAKVHQNMLIFCKGDWKIASAACRAETT